MTVVAALWSALAPEATALINQNYTPVELVQQSKHILHLELGPLAKNSDLPVRILKVVKGKAPQSLVVDLKATDQTLVGQLREMLGSDTKQSALLFSGSYVGVKDDAEDEKAAVAALLQVGSRWFSLKKGKSARGWILGPDELNLQAVWGGGTEMLLRAVRYVMTDPNPDVPTAVDAEWGEKARIATVKGMVHGLVPVDLFGSGETALFILAESGDRMFQYDAGKKGFRDVTSHLKLALRSKAAAWADLNGDGRLDLACWDGDSLTLWVQSAKGTFESRSARAALRHGCMGLSVVNTGVKGQLGILVSTAKGPMLVSLSGDGSVSTSDLPPTGAGGAPGAKLGEAGPCLVADFDGDSYADTLQPFARDGLFYKGKAGGGFETPKPVGEFSVGGGDLNAFTGDYDADGLLDVLVTGKGGCSLWHNRGGGKFESITQASGEVVYLAKPNCVGGATCDINNDGRQDILLLYANMGPQIFFNRGFCCFGYALALDLIENEVLPAAGEGQQAGLIVDLNGDGAQDLVLAQRNGEVWAIFRQAGEDAGAALGVHVALPPGGPSISPVRVTGWEGKRCLGAWNVRCGIPGTLFGVVEPGPVTLKWRFPGGETQKKELIVEEGLLRFLLRPAAQKPD